MAEFKEELGDSLSQVTFVPVELISDAFHEKLSWEFELRNVIVVNEHGHLLVILQPLCLRHVELYWLVCIISYRGISI